MGCSSSREALGGVVSPSPAERWQGLRSRSLPARLCRGGHDGAGAYTPLPSEEAALTSTPSASATSSWTAQWRSAPEPAPSLQLAAPLDLDPAAILPGSGQPVEVPPSPSDPALLYPEQENPPPPPEKTCEIDMGTPAARDIPEVITSFVELHEKIEKKAAAAEDKAAAPGFAGGGEDDVTPLPPSKVRPPPPPRTGKGAVVVYFTSLRGVRRTFEDCRAVRAILRCYGVRLDERDVSMHAAFKSELRALLLLAADAGGGGGGGEGAPEPLPRVFVVGAGGRRGDLGGAEEVRALHEAGELAGALTGCDAAPAAGRPGHAGACAACGGEARFVPCGECHGSRKVFVDDERCRFAGFFRQCPDCNENGLIRCPVCCY